MNRRALLAYVALACTTVPLLGCGARTASARRPTAANHPPSVRARCEPCRVEVGTQSSVSAEAADPDGDGLTFRWQAAA